jgi:hypothetical protein
MCMFCRSLFVLLYFFFSPLCCLFFFDIRILITHLVSSNSSYYLPPFHCVFLTPFYRVNTGTCLDQRIFTIHTNTMQLRWSICWMHFPTDDCPYIRVYIIELLPVFQHHFSAILSRIAVEIEINEGMVCSQFSHFGWMMYNFLKYI